MAGRSCSDSLTAGSSEVSYVDVQMTVYHQMLILIAAIDRNTCVSLYVPAVNLLGIYR